MSDATRAADADDPAPEEGKGSDRADDDAGPLTAARTGRYADLALFVAVAVGLAATTVHWAGLVAGGVLVGLVAPTLRRAFATGLSFGLVTLVAFAGWLAWTGALGPTLAATQLAAVAVGAALALPAVAATGVRALG